MKSFISIVFIAAMVSGFVSCAQKSSSAKNETSSQKDLSKYSHATFAAGCFWHEEALFESVKGIADAVSGYAGGTAKNPDYEMVENGNTGYAESVTVYYDPSQISYATLLKVYFAGQDPTQTNGQAPDFGSQYRSIAFYENNAEKTEIENYIKQLNQSGKYKAPIAVQVMPLTKFWPAENYHQDYIAKNPDSRYVENVSIPEIKKFQKEYPELIKQGHFF
ncbi:MAG TPA: peptide-methionine (S)-S-oxide reductase MsrA [Hanamia sp.]|nr:peptide-methionine (S)-S-oxide reductase MsrA [Hanamia sp.]